MQKSSIAPEFQALKSKIDVFSKVYAMKPFGHMQIEDITSLLRQSYLDDSTNGGQYFDLEFIPSDEIICRNEDGERLLDTVVHWRRPSEFLMNPLDVANDLNKLP